MRALVSTLAIAAATTLGAAPADAVSLRLYHTLRVVDAQASIVAGVCTAEVVDVPFDATVTTNVRCSVDGRPFTASSPTSRADAPVAVTVGQTYEVCLSGSATVQRPGYYHLISVSIGCYTFTA